MSVSILILYTAVLCMLYTDRKKWYHECIGTYISKIYKIMYECKNGG